MPPFLPSTMSSLPSSSHQSPSGDSHLQSEYEPSSPIRRTGQRGVVDFGLDEEIHTMEEEDFLNFLNAPRDHLSTDTQEEFTRETFIETANNLALSMKSRCECFFPLSILGSFADLQTCK
jgi:hypothetical protein